jgi:hypothetical protein
MPPLYSSKSVLKKANCLQEPVNVIHQTSLFYNWVLHSHAQLTTKLVNTMLAQKQIGSCKFWLLSFRRVNHMHWEQVLVPAHWQGWLQAKLCRLKAQRAKGAEGAEEGCKRTVEVEVGSKRGTMQVEKIATASWIHHISTVKGFTLHRISLGPGKHFHTSMTNHQSNRKPHFIKSAQHCTIQQQLHSVH